MELEIISPEKVIFTGEVKEVNLPGSAGRFSILPHHAALISSLGVGDLVYTTEDGEKRIGIDSGFAEVKEDKVSVCIEKVIAFK